ncbi:hypothetical protein [Saccharospirillum impatiens]|nr:hypothetical protein [Saccharospirillum impatiens]
MFSTTKTRSSYDETLWAALQEGDASSAITEARKKATQLCRDFPAYG